MTPSANKDSLCYFVAMIAQMATTLKEFGMPDAAESLDKAKNEIENRLADEHKLVIGE